MHQQSNYTGNHGNLLENKGNTVYVPVPLKQWHRIETAVIKDEDLINECEVMEEFGISKKTLCNYVSCGRIPKSFYTVCFNGAKMFFNKKLLGLKK